MKRCSQCGEREGVIDLTHVEGTEVRTLHLCAKCAAEKGIQTPGALADTPLGGLLAALGADSAAATTPLSDAMLGVECPRCGATLQDFRETGRLGCAHCYVTFGPPLRELLRRLHGSAHHTGKRYLPPETRVPDVPAPDRAFDLREQLRRAIEAEEFELAAKLRDRLKDVE
jgi:protein arginine kinase activator